MARTPEEIVAALDEVARLIERESAAFEGQRKIDVALALEHHRRLADETAAKVALYAALTELATRAALEAK